MKSGSQVPQWCVLRKNNCFGGVFLASQLEQIYLGTQIPYHGAANTGRREMRQDQIFKNIE